MGDHNYRKSVKNINSTNKVTSDEEELLRGLLDRSGRGHVASLLTGIKRAGHRRPSVSVSTVQHSRHVQNGEGWCWVLRQTRG